MRLTSSVCVVLVILLSYSCASHSELVNFDQGPEFPYSPQAISNFKPISIQADDILHITVHSIDPIAAQPFNTINTAGANAGANNRDVLQLNGYLVDQDGMIDFPVLGRVNLGGQTVQGAKDVLLEKLRLYLKDPVVNLRLLNFRINITGEVRSPGAFSIPNERVTVLEALAMAGDLTPFANRERILLAREINGERTFGYIDLNSSEVFNSPYFFLQQNDLLYVEPLPTKVSTVRDPATRILPWVSAFTSTAAFLISILRN